jgi:hypothetical protein
VLLPRLQASLGYWSGSCRMGLVVGRSVDGHSLGAPEL